jgi:hypothetical protein
VIWRVFKKSPSLPSNDSWWRDADRAAESPDRSAIDDLAARATAPDDDADEAERREEMIDGLRQQELIAAAEALPVVVTQHRVIGADRCHFVTPVSLTGDVSTPGKVFLTGERLVFVGARVNAWPWHRVRDVARSGRHLVVVGNDGAEAMHLQCNTYGDALVIQHVAKRLKRR